MNQPKGLPFGWYLYIWQIVLKGDEQTFWRTMNPRRVLALYREHLRATQPRPLPSPSGKAAAQPPEGVTKPRTSLFAYITGKGG